LERVVEPGLSSILSRKACHGTSLLGTITEIAIFAFDDSKDGGTINLAFYSKRPQRYEPVFEAVWRLF
jgi:hypothetical protein